MNTGLSFQYPSWFILFCVLLGIAYALALYFRTAHLKEQPNYFKIILGIFRFAATTILAILLLSPILQSLVTEKKKPIIVLAQDQSESISAAIKSKDTIAYKTDFEALKNALADKFEVVEYAFGDEVREGIDYQFKDKTSNISDVFSEVYDLYSNQNLGAMVLATDGIYNEGSSPIYAGAKLNVPIYTIALGDTTIKKDMVMKRVLHNKIAYLGDKFSIQADVTAGNAVGANTKVVISKVENDNVQKLQEFSVAINSNDFFTTQEVILEATQAGVQRYRVQVLPISGEVSTANNSQDIFVDVLDARQKVLIVANAPHPDISAFKQTIANNKNYEIDVTYVANIDKRIADYNLIIMHQVPSSSQPVASLLKQMNDNRIPRLFVVGSQSNISEFNQAQQVLTISGSISKTNDVQSLLQKNFNLFTLSDELKQEVAKFPPLIAPFGDFKAGSKTDVLLYQKIGTVDTKYPLLIFGDQRGVKVGVLAGEGIWKWRLFDYLQRKNYDIFEELTEKTIQYLTVKEDKRRFRVNVNKNVFDENEPVYFDAQLYNQSYELINEPDVSLTIKNSAGKTFPFTFSKTDKAYTLNASYFPVGNYSYEGKVTVNGQQLTSKGQFSVRPIQLELFETTADHALLSLLSDKYDGEMFYKDNLNGLADALNNQENIKPKLYDTLQTKNVINLKWIFFVILALLSLEWFLRRYWGSY